MLLFILFALTSVGLQPMHDYGRWRACMGRTWVTLALLVFAASLVAHMWVGLRDVLLDYAKPAGLRDGLLGAVAVALTSLGLWIAWILLQLHA
jgi:succinate dehydrogenase / fumarate reductase membrane anchor subunit